MAKRAVVHKRPGQESNCCHHQWEPTIHRSIVSYGRLGRKSTLGPFTNESLCNNNINSMPLCHKGKVQVLFAWSPSLSFATELFCISDTASYMHTTSKKTSKYQDRNTASPRSFTKKLELAVVGAIGCGALWMAQGAVLRKVSKYCSFFFAHAVRARSSDGHQYGLS